MEQEAESKYEGQQREDRAHARPPAQSSAGDGWDQIACRCSAASFPVSPGWEQREPSSGKHPGVSGMGVGGWAPGAFLWPQNSQVPHSLPPHPVPLTPVTHVLA